MKPVMFIFSGLPGTGKTTLAKEIAKLYMAAYFRIDTIEHGIRELCSFNVQGEGYRLTYRMAKDNLHIGNNVVADCCNPVEFIRKEWMNVAAENGANYINIEIKCTDKDEHKKRIENRKSDIPGLRLPSWDEVFKRDYEEWKNDVIRIETSGKTEDESIDELVEELNRAMLNFAR